MISVILPVLDGIPWLEEQLRALEAQRFAGEWELLIADNGSTDDSPRVARRWAGMHDNIRVIDASSKLGAPAARNAGVQAAGGELLAFCDADDVVGDDWLAACAQALEGADVAAGVFDFRSLNRPAGTTDPPGDARAIPAATSQFGFLPAGLAANMAVRRDAFEAVGGFDEDLLVGEDIDLCWRLQLAGYRFTIEPRAQVSKRGPTAFAPVFRHAYAYGLCGPVLFRRHRGAGARRDLAGAARSWLWLLLHVPLVISRGPVRGQWARAAGMRTGRLAGSVRERAFFP